MKYGYARVSTVGQCPEAQVESLKSAGCEHVYVDQITGTTISRPQLDKLRAIVTKGDSVVVVKMDRLFRSLSGALNQLEDWTEAGVTFECLDQPLLNTTDNSPTGTLMRQILGAFAQFERSLIVERTREGRERAKARGVLMGRRRKLKAEQIKHAAELVNQGKTVPEVAKLLGVERTTMWRRLKEVEAR
ncbi:MAG: recombinase family protein [Pseudomonadales bacterium]